MDTGLLKEIDLFKKVDDSTVDAIAAPSFLQNFPSNVVLARQGAPADFLFVLMDGLVEVRAEIGDRQHTLAIVEPTSVLLAEPVISDEIVLAECRTIAASRLVMIPAAVVRWAMERDAAFCRGLLRIMAQSSRSYMRQLNGQKLRNGIERLAAWALDEWTLQGRGDGFDMRHSKRVLANLLGMTPENLSRTLASLEDSGLRFTGRRVEIWNPDGLRGIADLNPLIDRSA
jgi:CRP/FNR family transcriptional regulator, transcriptional activator FtrB